LRPLNTEETIYLADCYAVTNHAAQAIPLYTQVLDVPDCAVHAHHNLCELYCRQNDFAHALAIIEHLEQKHLGFPNLAVKKAECLRKIGNKK